MAGNGQEGLIDEYWAGSGKRAKADERRWKNEIDARPDDETDLVKIERKSNSALKI